MNHALSRSSSIGRRIVAMELDRKGCQDPGMRPEGSVELGRWSLLATTLLPLVSINNISPTSIHSPRLQPPVRLGAHNTQTRPRSLEVAWKWLRPINHCAASESKQTLWCCLLSSFLLLFLSSISINGRKRRCAASLPDPKRSAPERAV